MNVLFLSNDVTVVVVTQEIACIKERAHLIIVIISICSKNLSPKFVSLFKNSTGTRQFFRFQTAPSKCRKEAPSSNTASF